MLALLVPLVASFVFAGCIGSGQIPDQIVAEASEAYTIPDNWAYSGNGVRSIDGSISIDVTDSTDSGTVTATVDTGDTTYEITLQEFQGNKSHQDGGINHGFLEHGDTGNGDANIPTSFALSAGWGIGEVTRDGEAFADPLTGENAFSVHYMLFQGGVRDDEDHAIYKSDRNGFYTPSEPGDAHVDPEDHEVHLLVKSTGEALPDLQEEFTDLVTDSDYQRDWSFVVGANQSVIQISIELTPPREGVTPAQLNFQLLGPDGEVLDSASTGGTGQTDSAQIRIEETPGAGNYTLRVSGSGVQTEYTATTQVVYPTPVFMHFLFEQVDLQTEIQVDSPLAQG